MKTSCSPCARENLWLASTRSDDLEISFHGDIDTRERERERERRVPTVDI